MPIVFVHGVNNRLGPSYEAGRLAKEGFLKRHLTGATIHGKQLTAIPKVWFPYWGDLATDFAWKMASLPEGEMQSLGGTASPDLQPLVAQLRDALPGTLGPEPLTALAKQRLALAVDVINALALDTAEAGKEAEVASFVIATSAYADQNPKPPWLAAVANDSQLIAQLQAQVTAPAGVQALGALGSVFGKVSLGAARLKQAVAGIAGKAVDKTGDFASTKLLGWARSPLNEVLGRFFGDIFIYFNERGDAAQPGKIPQRILAAVDDARQSSPAAEPLVLIGHSLGGVITMDLLGSFRPNLEVDLFVSVGSQVAHFEELKLYRASDKTVGPPKRAKKPANIHRWINVYDEVDIFAYAADRVFEGVNVDARYDTATYTIKAHGAYFDQDRFYQRLRARIDGLP
jgi:hypothetical protein